MSNDWELYQLRTRVEVLEARLERLDPELIESPEGDDALTDELERRMREAARLEKLGVVDRRSVRPVPKSRDDG